MTVREERKTARSLERSLRSTQQGLAALLNSLERSGLGEAVSSYQELELVLLQQRLWSRTYRRDELNALWREIAETATAIHAILAPFSAVMDTLREVDRIEPRDERPAPQAAAPSPEARMALKDTISNELVDLLLDELFISHFKLARHLSWPDDVRQARLQQLTEGGILERRGWGRGLSYRLAPESRQKLASQMESLLRREDAPAQKAV
jgi:hypothetical protein